MAYTKEQWEEAKAYFEAGLSLSKINEKTGISRTAIQKRTKSEQWEQGRNTDYIEARKIVAEKKGTESERSLRVLDNIAEHEIEVMRIQKKALGKADKMLDQIDSPNDLKTIVEAVDKASITLRVSERHAPKQDLNVANNTQVIQGIQLSEA